MTGGPAPIMTDLLASLPLDRIRLDSPASSRAEVLAELAALLGGRCGERGFPKVLKP